MDIKKLIIGGLILFGLGIGVGKYLVPNKVTESTSTETDTKKETSTTIKEETRPDGTKIKETTTVTKKEDNSKKETSKVIDNVKPSWKAGALAGYNFDTVKPVYGIVIEKRVLANIFVGAWGTTDKQAGVSVTLEF